MTTYSITLTTTGDTAEADTLDAALLAARTLVDDACTASGNSTSPRRLRPALHIFRDGVFDGLATTLARDGRSSDADLEADARYTEERIAGYTDEELAEHLAERKNQLARAGRDMGRLHDEISKLDPDTRDYADAIANLSSTTREHATQKRIVRRLDNEEARRRIAAAKDERSRAIAEFARMPGLAPAARTEADDDMPPEAVAFERLGERLTDYCQCDDPVMDVEHDAGCRRCGRPVDFSPTEGAFTVVLIDRYGDDVADGDFVHVEGLALEQLRDPAERERIGLELLAAAEAIAARDRAYAGVPGPDDVPADADRPPGTSGSWGEA